MEPKIYRASERYPQPGERVWLSTNQPPAYDGVAVAEPDGLMWAIRPNGYDYCFPIAIDDEYHLLPAYEPPRLTTYGDNPGASA